MATEKFGLLCYATSSQTSEDGLSEYEQPEIHLNIWEQEKSNKQAEEAFLDIGLMLDMKYPASTIELIFPWEVIFLLQLQHLTQSLQFLMKAGP
jgi:hypothetical protein